MDTMRFPDSVLNVYMNVSTNKEAVIKKKLSEVLTARLSDKSDAVFDNLLASNIGTAKGFSGKPEVLLSTNPSGWGYTDYTGYSQDYEGYEEEVFTSRGHYCEAAIWLNLIGYFEYFELIDGTKYDNMPREEVIETIFDDCGWEFTDSDGEEYDLDGINEVLDAIELAKKGEISSEMDAFLEGLSDLTEDAFTSDFIFDNLSFFTESLTHSCADYPVTTIVVKSKEIFEYKEYRENVPEDIRVNVDNAIQILMSPTEESYVVAMDNAEGRFSAIAFQLADSSDAEGQSYEDMHPLYNAALNYLVDRLPELRRKYGGTHSGVSGSFGFFMSGMIQTH